MHRPLSPNFDEPHTNTIFYLHSRRQRLFGISVTIHRHRIRRQPRAPNNTSCPQLLPRATIPSQLPHHTRQHLSRPTGHPTAKQRRRRRHHNIRQTIHLSRLQITNSSPTAPNHTPSPRPSTRPAPRATIVTKITTGLFQPLMLTSPTSNSNLNSRPSQHQQKRPRDPTLHITRRRFTSYRNIPRRSFPTPIRITGDQTTTTRRYLRKAFSRFTPHLTTRHRNHNIRQSSQTRLKHITI